MKKKIGALMLSIVIAVTLLAGLAQARDRDDYRGRWRGNEWREYHPYPGCAYRARPPWIYAQSRYRSYNYHWRWPWEDHDGWRGHHGG